MVNKIFKGIDLALKTIIAIIVASFIVIVFVQVVARFVFQHSLTWTEELARILFTQMIFYAAPLAVLEKRHIAVDILQQFMSVKTKRYLYVVINALSFVFFIFLLISGVVLLKTSPNQMSPAMGIPSHTLYTSIIISSVLMLINCIRAGYDDFVNTYNPDKEVAAK